MREKQHMWKRTALWFALLSMIVYLIPMAVFADAVEGDTVVTLGDALSEEQRAALLEEMDVDEDVHIEYVSNEEEHHYLGDYISASRIGTRALSSTRIILAGEGYGIHVETNNISWVTEEMYANAMVTAGIGDADVYVTAPFEVSGTAALTGIIKAFESAWDMEISEEQKQVANEEMVTTAELADSIGSDEAVELMIRLKELLNETELETDDDYRTLVLNVAAELNIELTDEDVDSIVHLLKRLKGLNINWDQVSGQLQHIRDNLGDILSREDTQNFLRRVLDFFIGLIDQLTSLFERDNS